MAENGDAVRKKRVTRSPQYPAFDLKTAIEKTRELYKKEGLHEVPFTVAIQDIGYSHTGSTGLRALAALSHFGLVTQEGGGDKRTARVSRLGRDIVLDEREHSEERDEAIREAALKPNIYAALYERFGASPPSAETVKLWLIKEHLFNPESVAGLFADYRATVEFARLDKSPRGREIPEEEGADANKGGGAGASQDPPPGVKDSPPNPPRREGMHAGLPPAESVWDLPIRLIGGGQALLRVPVPLSEENYNLLRKVVEMNLELQKPALTERPVAYGEGEE